MKTKNIAVFASLVLVASLICAVAAAPGAAAQGGPLITILPKTTFLPVKFPVNIPDPALHKALHAATGVPLAEDIFTKDLAQLSGALNLSGKGIANVEGLQYCVNVGELYLENNDLSELPAALKNMKKLKHILLTGNEFTEFPGVFLNMPWLFDIRLGSNKIGKLPDTIDAISDLGVLYVEKNKLTALPAALKKLTKLQILYCNGNQIKKLPKELFQAPSLEKLCTDQNRLTELPAEVKTAPKLMLLSVSYNQISKLPSGIGSAPKLAYLLAGYNALTGVEASLYTGNTKYLVLDGNRIRSLPDAMTGKSFQILGLEWNFMDVAPGTKNRAVIDSLTIGNDIRYQSQLSPVSITSASSTKDSVTLQWKALSDGSAGAMSWKVDKFVVYDGTGSPAANLMTLDESAAGCTVAGLSPGKEYNLFVRVYYNLDQSGMKSATSCDTYSKVSTGQAGAAASTATAGPAETDAAEATTAPPEATEQAQTTEPSAEATDPIVTASAQPGTPPPSQTGAATSVPASARGGDSGLMIAVIAVGAAIVLAIAALIVVLLARRPKIVSTRR